MKIALVALQILGRSRSEVNRQAREHNVCRTVVYEIQVAIATPCMGPVDRVSTGGLAHGQRSIVDISLCSARTGRH